MFYEILLKKKTIFAAKREFTHILFNDIDY